MVTLVEEGDDYILDIPTTPFESMKEYFESAQSRLNDEEAVKLKIINNKDMVASWILEVVSRASIVHHGKNFCGEYANNMFGMILYLCGLNKEGHDILSEAGLCCSRSHAIDEVKLMIKEIHQW